MKTIFSKLSVVGLTLAVALVGNSLISTGSAHAYSNNNMIDNAIFDNTNSMSTAQIQSFLNQFPNSCIKNYQAPDPTGWSTYGAMVPASQVIKDAAVLWQINPQVLLTTMEKEEGLVRGDGAYGCSYTSFWSAMGDNCPGSTTYSYTAAQVTGSPSSYSGGVPADISNGAGPTCVKRAQDVGFSAQVSHGAWQLAFGRHRSEGDGNLSWDGDNTMWYYGYMTATATGQTRPRYQSDPSPQAYSGNITLSDGANVTLANGATASLYSYTPYIQSFDTIFSGWFGPPNGTPIIQISGDPTEYLVWGDSYYPIPSSAVLAAWGYGSTPITPTSSTYLTSLKQGPTLSILAKFGSNQTAYLIDSGKSNGFPNGTIYSDYGYTFGTSETAYSASLQNAVAVGSTMTPIAQAPDGAVYQVTANKKDIFPDYQTFSTLGSPVYSSRPVVNLSSAYVNQIPSGPPMLLNGKFVRQSDGSSIYIYDQGSLYLLTPQAYQAWGGELDYSFPSILLNQLPSNGVAPVFAMSPDGTKYMIDSGRKLGMAADVQAAWGVANSSFANMSYQLLNRLLDANLSTLTQGSSQAVYLVQGGQTHVFPSGSDLTSYGYTRNLISQVSDYSISQQVSGAPAYAPGSLLRAPDGTIYWIDAGFQSMTIPSLAVFDTFGFNTLSSMRNIDSSTANSFTNRGVLSNIIKASDGTYYLVDSGVKLLISANAYSSSQFNFASHATTQVSTGIAATITNGYALTQYIQGSGQTIYMVNSGQKQPFGSPSSFFAHGGTWASVIHLSDDFINSLPTGAGL